MAGKLALPAAWDAMFVQEFADNSKVDPMIHALFLIPTNPLLTLGFKVFLWPSFLPADLWLTYFQLVLGVLLSCILKFDLEASSGQ